MLNVTAAAVIAARNVRALRSPVDTPVHKAADKHLDALTVAVRYTFAKGRKALGKSANADAAVKAVKAALLDVLPDVLLSALLAGGKATTLKVSRAAERRALAGKVLDFRFDVSNPLAAQWAREHAAELAKGISETTREDIAAAIANQEETGESAYDDILDAVGDDARAELIARTETMFAANEGQRQAWDQAVDKGLLDEDSKRVWIAAGDACPECDELDGEETTLDGEYPGDGGDGPPLHPACRCTEGIVS